MTLDEIYQKQESLEARLTHLEDVEAIQKMTYEYFDCVTLGKTDRLIDFFADDCAFVIPRGRIEGREQVKSYLDELCGWHTGAESNFLIHPIIEAEWDHARGHWLIYFINTYYLTSQPLFVTASMYDNEYVKVNGQWKFKEVHWIMRFGPPAPPPFPGCHGRKMVGEADLRGFGDPLKQLSKPNPQD